MKELLKTLALECAPSGREKAVAKLIEKEPIGPIKKIAFMSNQIISVALQEEICQQ